MHSKAQLAATLVLGLALPAAATPAATEAGEPRAAAAGEAAAATEVGPPAAGSAAVRAVPAATEVGPPAAGSAAVRAVQPFSPGEELVYAITALGMKAGKARISVGLGEEREGVKAWPVVVQARTDSLFDAVYSVRDRFVTWWDPATGRVVGSDFYADEGGKRHRSRSTIDHAKGTAEVQRVREWNGQRSKRSYEIPPGAFDIAGAIFELRRRQLRPGEVEEIDVFTGRSVFKLRCIVEKVERIETKAGSFEATATRIQLGFDGHFKSKRDVRAWFSTDERQVPIRFEADFALGSIVADLIEAKRGVRTAL